MKYFKYIIIVFLFVTCASNDSSSTADNNQVGQGGSTARFAIVGNYLYTVDDDDLNVFSITNTTNPVLVNEVYIGFRIETIFSFENNLFIGSQGGMYIYNLDNPEVPIQQSEINHFTACDPVVTDGNYAYVTLHSNSNCGNNINSLEIYNVEDIENPILIESRNMIQPKGLGIYNDYLIICDDEVKIFDISDPENMVFSTSINVSGFDVIIKNDDLIVVAKDGLYQYRLDNTAITNVTALSVIGY